MRIAFVCPDMLGHLNPTSTLASEFQRRGHEAILYSLPPAASMMTRVPFMEVCNDDYEKHIVPLRQALPVSTGLSAVRLTGKLFGAIETLFLEELPNLFCEHQIEAVVFDQISPSGGCVAEWLGMPYAMIMNALNLQQEKFVPPVMLNWQYDPSWYGRRRNQLGNLLFRLAARPVEKVLLKWRKDHGLRKLAFDEHPDYAWIQVAQTPEFFDLPRCRLPKHFHYTAPWHEPNRDKGVLFPWHSIDSSKPLIYASLGTMQNGNAHLYQAIIDAVESLKAQLVLSMGNPGSREMPGALEFCPTKNSILVRHAPQTSLVQRADLVITHAGLNTALECLAAGVPMLCLPITNDQPGVAERVRHLGVGLSIPAHKATKDKIRAGISQIMESMSFQEEALYWQHRLIELPNGIGRAADLIEETLKDGIKVLNRRK